MSLDLCKRAFKPDKRERRHCAITAGNVSKLLNVHPYTSCHKLLWVKLETGNASPKNTNQKRGIELEDEALKMYAKATNRTIVLKDSFIRHEKYSYLIAQVDAVTACGHVVEIKCPQKVRNYIPEHHKIQMQVTMEVCGIEQMCYVQYVRGHALNVKIVSRERDSFASMLCQIREFAALLFGLVKKKHANKELEGVFTDTQELPGSYMCPCAIKNVIK